MAAASSSNTNANRKWYVCERSVQFFENRVTGIFIMTLMVILMIIRTF
uniref:Uncharacterized protein n=1 Tax=Anguilla anguilla TaxID=7936 RepID=A0A0E9R354_ANGAN